MRAKRGKPTTLCTGTISEGTLRTEDLIDALLPELEQLRLTRAERIEVREIRAHVDRATDPTDPDWDQDEERDWDYDALCQIADAHVPAYSYFGALDGDGACIGVWPILPEYHDEDVQRSSEPPHTAAADAACCDIDDHAEANRRAYWLHVNDHGNATLYARTGKTWARYREVWSVV